MCDCDLDLVKHALDLLTKLLTFSMTDKIKICYIKKNILFTYLTVIANLSIGDITDTLFTFKVVKLRFKYVSSFQNNSSNVDVDILK